MASNDLDPTPEDPLFYRRVLHESPAPVLVVNADAEIVYANRSLGRLGNWDLDDIVGRNVVEFVHPDDAEDLAAAFLAVVASDESHSFDGPAWAAINTRLISADGQTLPVTVTGAGGLLDSNVNGIVYDVRPAHEQDILRRGLTSLALGEPIEDILQLITSMVALPPLGLDAALLEPKGNGTYRVIGATSSRLEEILVEAEDPQPWNDGGREPVCTLVARFPGGVGEDLFAAGYREFWHVSPEPNRDTDAFRLVACSSVVQTPPAGQVDRLTRANELAGVVLLRARADALLEHSATHDRLTQLPNREGFYRRSAEMLEEASAQSETVAMLFIDLDGFKEVNDEYGHAAGDRVLEVIAYRLMSVTRSVDLVARLGGDEFVILVGASRGRPASALRVEAIALRALQELRREIDIGEANVTVSASVGAILSSTPTSVDALLARADAAMYVAKHAGGNHHHIVDELAATAPTPTDGRESRTPRPGPPPESG